MAKYDLHNNIDTVPAFNTATVTSDSNGLIIDTVEFFKVEFSVQSGTVTDGSYSWIIQEGAESDGSDMADVAADDILGAGVTFAATDDNVAKRIGYRGKQRYVRIRVDETGASSGGTFTATAILAGARSKPVAE